MDPLPPHKMNLQGLLRFALEHTKSEDAPSESVYQQMDPERRDFLEKALKSMTIDVIEEFQKAIEMLQNTEASVEEKLNALSVIREQIDDLDFANNFIKVGGSPILLEYLKSTENKLLVSTIYIVAEMSQNNPYCQKHFVDAKVIPLLVSHLSGPEEVVSSALHAISSLTRNYEPGVVELLQIGGIAAIINCLGTSHSRVFVKACFIMANMSLEFPGVREEFVKKKAIEKLLFLLEPTTGFDIKLETVLFALSVLTKCDKWTPLPEDVDVVKETLNEIIERNKDSAECEETVAYAKEVLQAFSQ